MTNEDKARELALQAENGINDLPAEDKPKSVDLSELKIGTMPRSGYYPIDKAEMPFGGKQYPADMQFEVRSAGTTEIKHWSTIDDNIHPQKLYGYFNSIVEKCVRVINGSWHEIKESDRMWFVMYIHELTFIEAERPLVLNSVCKQRSCGEEFRSQLSKEIIQYNLPDEKLVKYINSETGCFDVSTKTYGTITINMPTLKTGSALMAYMNAQKSTWVEENTGFLDLASYLVPPHATPTDKLFESLYLQYRTWDVKQLTFMMSLIKQAKIVPNQLFNVTCPKCGTKSEQALDLEGGIRSFFLPISDLSDELL